MADFATAYGGRGGAKRDAALDESAEPMEKATNGSIRHLILLDSRCLLRRMPDARERQLKIRLPHRLKAASNDKRIFI